MKFIEIKKEEEENLYYPHPHHQSHPAGNTLPFRNPGSTGPIDGPSLATP